MLGSPKTLGGPMRTIQACLVIIVLQLFLLAYIGFFSMPTAMRYIAFYGAQLCDASTKCPSGLPCHPEGFCPPITSTTVTNTSKTQTITNTIDSGGTGAGKTIDTGSEVHPVSTGHRR